MTLTRRRVIIGTALLAAASLYFFNAYHHLFENVQIKAVLLWLVTPFLLLLGSIAVAPFINRHQLVDLDRREIASLTALVVFIVWIGVYPSTFLKSTAPVAKSVVQLIENVRKGVRPPALAGSPTEEHVHAAK
jgi:NADH:ubiquinone oxidoreductase subunit 4 (subunit M)